MIKRGHEVDSKLLRWINQPHAKWLAKDWKSWLEKNKDITQLNRLIKRNTLAAVKVGS